MKDFQASLTLTNVLLPVLEIPSLSNYFQNKLILNILSETDHVHLVFMQRKPWFLSI